MTVRDVMNKIKAAKEYSKFLDELADKERDEHIKDYLTESASLLDEYADVLERMNVQKTQITL